MRRRGSVYRVQRGGFTLIEVLVSVVILSVGTVLVLRAFETYLAALDEARDGLRAAHLVQSRLTSLRAGQTGEEGPVDGDSSGSFDEPFDAYRWRVSQSPTGLGAADPHATNTLDEVAVTVWREGSRTEYTLATYLRREP